MKGHGAIFSSEMLIGARIENSHGEELGYLEELMVNPENGDVVYALLHLEGLSGSNNKHFAIPWQALFIENGSEPVVVNVKKESIRSAWGMNKVVWPITATLHRL